MRVKHWMSGVLAGVLLAGNMTAYSYIQAKEPGEEEQPSLSQAQVSAQPPAVEEDPHTVSAEELMEAAGLDPSQIKTEMPQPEGEMEREDDLSWYPTPVVPYQAEGGQYMYLSDVNYESGSGAGWGNITKDTSINGQRIRLKLDGEVVVFSKGMGAHAESNLIYNIDEYRQAGYTQLHCYAGVDYSQNGHGDGVKFVVSGQSQDTEQWTVLKETEVVRASDNAVYLKIDVSGYNKIRLSAKVNGNKDNDHAVYGDLRLLKTDYDVDRERYDGLKKVAEYDKILLANSLDENLNDHKDVLLRREFVNRMGYQAIQAAVRDQANVRAALDWMLSDQDALQLFLEAGTLFNGSASKSLFALGDLYQAAKNEIGNDPDGYVRKKMMLATAVAYSRDIITFIVDYGGGYASSDPVVKYTKMKELFDNDRFPREQEFRRYPMELVRYVMDSKLDDTEIKWLREYSEQRAPDMRSRISGYTFLRYVNTHYNDPAMYDRNNQEKWNEKYKLGQYNVAYGRPGMPMIWMAMEKGGICWQISGTGMSIADVHGIPSERAYQPGHEAYLVYQENGDGKGIWEIWNDISGWQQSFSRWGNILQTEARPLMGWGVMDFNRLQGYDGNNMSYMLLGQAALNDYDNYLNSMFAHFLSQIYPEGSAQREAALRRCLQEQNINLDGVYGLIRNYRADSNTTQEKWRDLGKLVVDTYTFFPAVMVDLLNQITPHITDGVKLAEVNTWENEALHRASQATPEESLQNVACRNIANSLLGHGVELATFSFDGEHANSIVLDDSYADSQLMVRYSLDGRKTWTQSPEHIITLTEQQLKGVNAEDDIVVGLVGTEVTYTIDIKAGEQVRDIYLNDDEDLLLGKNGNMEFSLDGGQSWTDYQTGLASTTRFPGNATVKVRYQANGQFLQGSEREYTFHASTDTPDKSYLQLQHVKLHAFSTQQDAGSNAAANFIDGKGNTSWHSKWNYHDPDKFYTVKLDKVRYLSKITYLPGPRNGCIKEAEIYTSLDGQDWKLVNTVRDQAHDTQLKTLLDLETPEEALYVKVVATKTHGNKAGEENMFFSGNMLNFYEDTTQEFVTEGSVSYSTTDPTQENVTATLNLPQGATAEGETEHIFEENGTHTFTYTDFYGEKRTIDANVSWIDRQPPVGQVVYSTQNPTNQSVTVTLENLSEDVSFADGSNGRYVFDENGTYTFHIVDRAGNTAQYPVEVTWIDKVLPTGGLTYSFRGWTRDAVTVKLENLSEEIVFADGSNGEYTFEDNGSYTFEIRDAAGNAASYTAEVTWIDATKPDDEDVVTVKEEPGKSAIVLNVNPDRVEVLSVNGQPFHDMVYHATQSGSYTFTMRLKDTGYTFEHTVTVDVQPPLQATPPAGQGGGMEKPSQPEQNQGGSQAPSKPGGSNQPQNGHSGTVEQPNQKPTVPNAGGKPSADPQPAPPLEQGQQDSSKPEQGQQATPNSPATPQGNENVQPQGGGTSLNPIVISVGAVGVLALVIVGAVLLWRRKQ